MKRRKWDAKTKATIVRGPQRQAGGNNLSGLSDQPSAVLSVARSISGERAEDIWVTQQTDREARLQRENARLKSLVGE